MKRGDRIKVKAFGGRVLTRRVVGLSDQVVLISKEAEYQAAAQEGREPVCSGFPIKDIVGPMVRSRHRVAAS